VDADPDPRGENAEKFLEKINYKKLKNYGTNLKTNFIHAVFLFSLLLQWQCLEECCKNFISVIGSGTISPVNHYPSFSLKILMIWVFYIRISINYQCGADLKPLQFLYQSVQIFTIGTGIDKPQITILKYDFLYVFFQEPGLQSD